MTQIQSRLRRLLTRFGLLPIAFYVWRGLRSLSPATIARNYAARNASRIPIPPNSLIFASTATREVEWFLRSGEQTSRCFQDALRDVDQPIGSFRRVLDFGCGPGRVLRQWLGVEGPEYYGSDYNSRAVEWANTNLPHSRVSTNSLYPPLPFDSGFFDLCYSVSVFTHLPEDLQRPWIEELHRVIAPNGTLLLTLSGKGDFARLTAAERARFEKNELIVLDPSLAGTNMCGVFHPKTYVEREWGDLFSSCGTIHRERSVAPTRTYMSFGGSHNASIGRR